MKQNKHVFRREKVEEFEEFDETIEEGIGRKIIRICSGTVTNRSLHIF